MSNREIFIDKLRQLSKEEMLERYIALLNTEKLTDYVADLETKLADLQQEQIKEMQEHQEAMQVANKTITNLVEDNRASQEWYKKQLAEKDEQLEYFSERDEEQEKQLEKQAEFHRKSVLELKQQLAKKEEQVRKSQEMYFETLKELDELEDNFNNTSLELWAEKLITQDKISFCIEQLEKVQGYFGELSLYEMYDKIDNQIKQLKENRYE